MFSCRPFLLLRSCSTNVHHIRTMPDEAAIVVSLWVVWCSVVFCIIPTSCVSRWNWLSEQMSRLRMKLPLYRPFTTRTWVFGWNLYLALGRGLGSEILDQILDTVPHNTEKTEYSNVPRRKIYEYRLTQNTEKSIYHTVPYRIALTICGIPFTDTIPRISFAVPVVTTLEAF